MTKPNQITFPCAYCGISCSRKMSHVISHEKNYCGNNCRYLGRTKDIDDKKKEILEMYNSGMTAWIISQKLKIQYPRLCYHFHKWGVVLKKCYVYDKIMVGIGSKRKNKTEYKFLDRYANGEISWRHAHDLASRIWKITKKPCVVCGWEEAERDMHLIIPRLLEEDNAVSLCPNCHRLFHRGKIQLNKKEGKLIVVKI